MSTEKQKPIEHISWHPAFVEAIECELAQYKEVIEILAELQLTSEPLRIDLVIIKKLKDIIFTKNIAKIFRTHNLIEYKSPTDYLSVVDFYKVHAYAYLYMLHQVEPSSATSRASTVVERMPAPSSVLAEPVDSSQLAWASKLTARTISVLKDMTLTFVGSHYPRELVSYLEQERGYTVDRSSAGIYIVQGDLFPIQLIDTRELSEEENLWLRSLDDRLDVVRMTRLTQEIERLGETSRLGA